MTIPADLLELNDTEQMADDGTSKDDGGSTGELEPVDRPLGFILDEENEEKVAKHVVKLRDDQEASMSRRRAVWKRNRWWREGRRFVRLEKKENQQLWEAKLPYGMSAAPPVPNQTDRLVRRLGNTLLVDKPYPDCEPGDDSNEARDAAEFSTRYLAVKGSPAELNLARICRSAFDKAGTYASSFGWVIMDPSGAGHRPRRVLAHPEAPHQEVALMDPNTGLPAEGDQLKERFVRPDGALSDEQSDADYQWLPAPRIRLLTGLQVNFLPETARSVKDGIGLLITDFTTLGDLKQQFEQEIEALSDDQLKALCTWRPKKVQDVLPPYTPEPEDQKTEDGKWKDSQTVFTMTVYYRSCAEYPMGCYAVIGGDSLVLHRQKWTAMMESPLGPNGQEQPPKEECLEIPVSQCRCLDDDTFDDPYGVAITEHLGPSDEIAASSLGFELEYMFRAANPIPFIPMGSIVQPKQFHLRDGTPVYTNPQGTPFYEKIDPLSPTIPQMRVEMREDMDDAIGLQQAAQGVEDPSVKSGIHAQTIVQEALKAVSNMKDNIGDFYIDLNRIILQLSRAFCTVPQMISYVGDDGEYKEREWSRSDFRNTRVVSIAKGSFTMHTLLAKQEMANNAFDRKVIDADDYQELVAGGVSPVLGVQDNPHLLRIRRQIDKFTKGPPEDFDEKMAAYQEQVAAIEQQNAAAAQAGQSAVQTPPPPKPTPFDRLPIDLEPMAAKIRHRQLARTMASTRFANFSPVWKQTLLDEYIAMKNAAGIMTVPEVQQAQQQQQQLQEQQQAQANAIAAQQAQNEAARTAEQEVRNSQPPAPPPAPVINVHLPAEGAKEIQHIRDETGAVVGSRVVPVPA
jgi:hypothetical protein